MNIELSALKLKPKGAREFMELYRGYQLLFRVQPVTVFTGTLEKDGQIIVNNSTVILAGWGGYNELLFDVGKVENAKPVGEYRLFFCDPTTLGDRFHPPCTCSLVTVSGEERYIGGESDCPVHGFGE